MLCNLKEALQAGPHVIVLIHYGGPFPAPPFPEPDLWSYEVVFGDGDPATGAQVQGNNFLKGMDVYFEALFFRDSTGAMRGYVLGTDQAKPPRSDTNQLQGNLGTRTRFIAFPADGWFLVIVPVPDVAGSQEYLTGAFHQERRSGGGIGIDSSEVEPLQLP
jgi:hypothetical protein